MCCHQVRDPKRRRFLPATTPSREFHRHLDGLRPGSANDGTNTLDGGTLRIIEEVGVSGRRRRVAVPQKRADQRQARAAAGKLARKAVPQIVDP